MPKFAIVTDTDSSLTPELAERYGIRQVPITVHFDQETYTAGQDIDDPRLFEMIDHRKKLPTTAAPSPGAFAAAFESALTAGADGVICVCVSSKISATYASAVTACESFPGRNITVVDSLSATMGQGFLALAAAEAAHAGASKEEILAQIADTRQRTHLYAVLATLKYLAMSGRVGKIAAGMASTLNIKPVLTMRDGKLEMLEKVRTLKKAVDRMIELTGAGLDGQPVRRAAVVHVNNLEGAREMEALLRASFACPKEILIAPVNPGMSVHIGAGMVGFAVVA